MKDDLVCRDGGELSTRDLQKMVQALPQYSEQIDKLSLHVEVWLSFMGRDIVWLDRTSLPLAYILLFIYLFFNFK